MDVKSDIRFRVYLSFTGMLLLALAVIGKAIAIQVKDGDELRAKAERAHIRNQCLPSERGNIYSEDGTLLSSTIPQFDLRVDFSVINKDTFYHYVDTLSRCLAAVMSDRSAAEYKRDLKRAYRKGLRYWVLCNDAPYYKYQMIRSFPIFNKSKNKGGFIAEPQSKRVNPYGMLAYRTIGLWRENASNIGLEQRYDSILSGKDGTRVIRKTTGGVWMPIEGSEVDPVNGKDIVTTIDINIQDVAEHALLGILEKYKGDYGTAVVMEVATGKIRALANLGRQSDGSYWEDFNYAMIPTEPGSTFKLFSLLALVDDGYVTIDDKVNVGSGVAYFGRQRVVDDHRGLGTITVKEAFEQSSNVAFAKMVDKYYHDNPMQYIRHLQKLRLNVRTGIDINGERRPLIKTTESKSWNKTTSLPWIGYGYESLITPLHTCMVYNAVANNGKMMKPYLVSEIREYGKAVRKIAPTVLVEQIAKKSTIAQLQEALRAVVEHGTARGIKSPFYNIGGKTGTAQVADRGISYSDGVRQGSFVGYFPWNNPRYTICVVFRSTPHGAYYGAMVAAPVFKAIADKLYATHIGGWSVPADTSGEKPALTQRMLRASLLPFVDTFGWSVSAPAAGRIALVKVGRNGFKVTAEGKQMHRIPNLNGMGLKDALYLLESKGLHVTVSGSGKVIDQSLPAGQPLIKGQTIHLSLG